MASITLAIPPEPTATQNAQIGGGTEIYPSASTGDRVRTRGSDIDDQIMAYGVEDVTVPAGAPGTVTLDTTTMRSINAQLLNALDVAHKTVYLEVEQLTGTEGDCLLRRSAANPIILASGVTDTIAIYGRMVLVDVQPSTALLTAAAPSWTATAKNLTFESTAGCKVRVKLGVC